MGLEQTSPAYQEYLNNSIVSEAMRMASNWQPAEFNRYTQLSDSFENRLSNPTYDVVNKPQHYNSGKVECIDAIESAVVNKRGLEVACVANIIKYLWRYEQKNGIEDVKKAQWYLNKLIDTLSNRG